MYGMDFLDEKGRRLFNAAQLTGILEAGTPGRAKKRDFSIFLNFSNTISKFQFWMPKKGSRFTDPSELWCMTWFTITILAADSKLLKGSNDTITAIPPEELKLCVRHENRLHSARPRHSLGVIVTYGSEAEGQAAILTLLLHENQLTMLTGLLESSKIYF